MSDRHHLRKKTSSAKLAVKLRNVHAQAECIVRYGPLLASACVYMDNGTRQRHDNQQQVPITGRYVHTIIMHTVTATSRLAINKKFITNRCTRRRSQTTVGEVASAAEWQAHRDNGCGQWWPVLATASLIVIILANHQRSLL